MNGNRVNFYFLQIWNSQISLWQVHLDIDTLNLEKKMFYFVVSVINSISIEIWAINHAFEKGALANQIM